ncbi:hypothetical protein [Microbacterium sp.]|uniref:hypothetical protein n=1 Tax=Microbacterium sp. TaxID=51671 RepID=UPI003A85A7B7
MTLAAILVTAAAEGEHHVGLFDNIGFGVIALVAFLALALVTVSFRNVANRHSAKAEAYAQTHADELEAGHGHH